MSCHAETLSIAADGRSTIELTREVQRVVSESGVEVGLVNVFVHHTSASLIVSENADPTVRADLERFLSRLCPDGEPIFEHTAEGPDDMPAHLRSVLTLTSVTVPVRGGRADLGTWQGIYLWEHRHNPHRRRVTISTLA